VENSKNADNFKEISEKSFKEYNSLVTEYRNFHEKLVGNFKYQGAYNEKKLQKLLEKHGLVQDQDFTVRESQTNIDPETGEQRRINPDFVINLPEDNSIVIDCKVSLTNFASFANEKDKKQRNDHLKKHIASVKDHIKSLSKKNYNKIHNLKSFQYVIMFMPFDTCYLSVLEHDYEILEFTHQHKVILSGPISIMALIANVTSMKNQQKQLSIVENIVFSAEKVYDKYKIVKDNIRTLVSSFKTHKNSVEGLINNTYGSKRGLESLIKKLKDDNGLNPGSNIVESSEQDKVIGDIDDPEEKKVVNYKK
jgi:DNA recombination protein RmuC